MNDKTKIPLEIKAITAEMCTPEAGLLTLGRVHMSDGKLIH